MASKYRNKRTEYNGRTYASKVEAKRAWQLDRLVIFGKVLSWTPQPRFTLGCPENVYVADFLVEGADGTTWAEDVKGFETLAFKRNKRLWKVYGKHDLRILKRKGASWVVQVVKGGVECP